MKKKYIAPKTNVIKVQQITLLQASDISNQTYNIWYGGVDYGGNLIPD